MKLSLCSLGDPITDPVTYRRPTVAERHLAAVEMAVRGESAGVTRHSRR